MVSVTSLGDIAGQVTEASSNADKVTVGGVCLPSGAIKHIRDSIPLGFPKWRNAEDDHVEYIVNLMLREAFSVCAASLDKTTSDWQAFWSDARSGHAKTITSLKPATLIKCLLFAQASTMSLGHSIKVGTMPRVVDRKGQFRITESVIFDDEIQGPDNLEAFVDMWRTISAHQPKLNSLGMHRKVDIPILTTEEREPLLLLPDYVAGILHATNSDANTLSKSKVSESASRLALERLKTTPKFHEFVISVPKSYFDIFPDFR